MTEKFGQNKQYFLNRILQKKHPLKNNLDGGYWWNAAGSSDESKMTKRK
jgi:hypothetical protein